MKIRCATTHRQTTDRKSTRGQKLTDKKIFTDTTTEQQRQVADTTTHRQKPIIFLYKTDYHSQLQLHLSLKLMYNGFFCTFCRDILPKKSKDVYVEAFTALKSKMLELGLTIDLEIFRFDFETASHKAAKEVFRGIEIADMLRLKDLPCH